MGRLFAIPLILSMIVWLVWRVLRKPVEAYTALDPHIGWTKHHRRRK